ncbi:MAG TPA: undecaprenyl/decaprenyl-phosphate alpha-N-acetylglucosaminyl 1-phosphate transferase [Persephonella sp.]|nr:undecaprenyl/decaprenyl-phosphate alpha-N-acetylglucosaminyl 1-phosphate transferase [Hydrogenothermaceae bacterium]HIQ25621.1 undecaprenyl/decaprenyl-phosphate alpha-N-acetylglucosaminyl 1-phosphate transferase [Persephonella sp.]
MLVKIYVFFISFLTNIVFRVISDKKQIFIDKIDENKPQKVHEEHVPRIGGIGIFIAFSIFSIHYLQFSYYPMLFLLSSLPIIFIGILEDYKRNINQKVRLLFMSIGTIFSIILLNNIIYSSGFFNFPIYISIFFTIFALVGITNAINMIDGFNGLASGVIIITLISFIYVLNKFGDTTIIEICYALLFATLGFFVLNFPFGKIFLGDGGAYFLGFTIGIISILMSNTYKNISPWFPLLILAYPVVDVLFSIFRRVFIHKRSPFSPDKEHLHSLIYRVVTKSNWLTSVFIFAIIIPFNIFAILNYNNHLNLLFGFLVFVSIYIIIYFYLMRNLKYEVKKA